MDKIKEKYLIFMTLFIFIEGGCEYVMENANYCPYYSSVFKDEIVR
jgi:hypothetical protein